MPETVTVGSVQIKIYSTPVGKYRSHTVVHYFQGKRQRKRFTGQGSLQRAREHASEEAERIGQGLTHVLTAEQALEYREAKKHWPGSLIIAAQDYARRQKRDCPTVADAAAHLMAAKATESRRRPFSDDYTRKLKQHLETFARTFNCSLQDITRQQVQAWVDQIPGKLRTKNNYLSCARHLIEYAISERWLPKEFDELDGIRIQKAGPGKPQPYTPEESRKILRHAQRRAKQWLPYLPIRMFAGIRGKELLRLKPEDFHKSGWISCSEDITKTERRRLLPILPNLKRWLKRYPPRDAMAPASDYSKLGPALTRLIQAAGVRNRHNGFRDSYISYRMAVIEDAAKVAEETGHDARQLRASYREIKLPDDRLITKRLAKAYFSL